jgi:DNA-binding CsgD family transcriptional regulator
MQMALQAITNVIHAIGRDDFPSITANALCEVTSFDLATIIVHRYKASPSLVFDNFASTGSRLGLENYLFITHRLNPVLNSFRHMAAVRASDYKTAPAPDKKTLSYVDRRSEEELGFLTVGWPAKMEELGLYFETFDGVVEFCIYRERSCTPAPSETIHELNSLCAPMAAAFNCHNALACTVAPVGTLSPREVQVAELMLLGCSSEAIALRLQLSRHTVKDYRKQVFRKLGISSLAELFALSRHFPRASPQISPLRGDVPMLQ